MTLYFLVLTEYIRINDILWTHRIASHRHDATTRHQRWASILQILTLKQNIDLLSAIRYLFTVCQHESVWIVQQRTKPFAPRSRQLPFEYKCSFGFPRNIFQLLRNQTFLPISILTIILAIQLLLAETINVDFGRIAISKFNDCRLSGGRCANHYGIAQLGCLNQLSRFQYDSLIFN